MVKSKVLSGMVGCFLATSCCLGAGVPTRCLELPPGNDNPRNSEGAFATLKDGRILFIYTRYYGKSGADHGTADLAARYSSDAGATWTSEDVIVIKNECIQNVMSVSLLRLQNDDLALFYLRKNSDFDCRPVMRISRDEGATWGDAVECISDKIGYYVLNNDRVIQLKNGRLVMPVCQHSSQGDSGRDMAGTLMCYLSDDNGRTWRRGSHEWKTFTEGGRRVVTQEPGVVELKDGRLMMFIRSDAGCQLVSYSSDGGDTWTKSEKTSLLSPVSPASIKRIPQTGDLLVVWNDHAQMPAHLRGRRLPQSVAISRDEGATWELVKALEYTLDGGHFCYTAIHFTADDSVLLGYCALRGLGHSRIVKIPVSWLYDDSVSYGKTLTESVLKEAPRGGFTSLKTSLGEWTAEPGHCEIFEYARGVGVHLAGGNDRCVQLTFDKPMEVSRIPMLVERFTGRDPYLFVAEALVDGVWSLVGVQGDDTKVGSLLPLQMVNGNARATAMRFRCTSVAGAIIVDAPQLEVNSFFK